MICQPAQKTALLRRNLRLAGWVPMQETLVAERGKFYVNLVYRPSASCSEERDGGESSFPSAALLDEIGPCLWRTRPPGYRQYVQEIAGRYERIAQQVRRGENRTASSEKRLAELQRLNRELKKCLRELDRCGGADSCRN